MSLRRKGPGRPRRIPEPSEFGELLSIDQAAQCLGIGYNAMAKMICINNLPVLKIGRNTKVPKGTIEAVKAGTWRQLMSQVSTTDRSTA